MDWREIVFKIGMAFWIICFLIFAIIQIKKTGWAWWRQSNPLGDDLTPKEFKALGFAGLAFLIGLVLFAIGAFA